MQGLITPRLFVFTLLLLLAPTGLRAQSADWFGNLPPRGWASWWHYGTGLDTNGNIVIHNNTNWLSEELIKRVIDTMATNGLRDAGYNLVFLDDGWSGCWDSNYIVWPNSNFPSGIKALADYAHSKGMLFGIYGVAGHYTSGGASLPGWGSNIVGNVANAITNWGVDYIKFETHEPPLAQQEATLVAQTIAQCNSNVFLNISTFGYAPWMRETVNSWRSGVGIYGDVWSIVVYWRWLDSTPFAASCPRHYNDMDFLCDTFATIHERRAMLAMDAMLSAPILISSYCGLKEEARQRITYRSDYFNPHLRAIDEDLSHHVQSIATNGSQYTYIKELSDCTLAVALMNRATSSATMSFTFTNLPITRQLPPVATLVDCWADSIANFVTNSFSVTVPPRGVGWYRLLPGRFTQHRVGTNYLSHIPWLTASNNSVPYGNVIGIDGATFSATTHLPMVMGGVTYTNGLGLMAPAAITYWLGGQAESFSAILGLQDPPAPNPNGGKFAIYADATLVYSNVLAQGAPPVPITLNVAGARYLTLLTDVTRPENVARANTFANFANARIVCASAAPMPPVLQELTQRSNVLRMKWTALPGRWYQLQRKLELGGSWGNFRAPLVATNWLMETSILKGQNPMSFYRVLAVP